MRLIKYLKGLAITAAMFGILLPLPTICNAAEQAKVSRQSEAVQDLALGAGGKLSGQVVTKEGIPDRGANVAVIKDGTAIATAKTDNNGIFTVSGMPAGLYGLKCGNAAGVIRAWADQTAPPAASQAVLLVPSDLTVRGQGHLHDLLHDHHLGGCSLAQIGLGGLLVLGLAGTIIAVSLDNNAS